MRPVAAGPCGDRRLAAVGCPATGDLSGPPHEGTAWVDLAIDGGQRVSPAGAYLEPARHRPNLIIQPRCLVTQLLMGAGRCIGVSYLRDGKLGEAYAFGEVIVCAGAVGSPLPRSRYNHGEVYVALRSPLAGVWPDLHLFPILLPVAPTGRQPPAGGFALAAAVVAPDSRGWVRLATPDPRTTPVINPAFLRDPRDTGRLEAGLTMVRDAAATDAAAVVDTGLRVRGITGLRVADASVMPVLPNAHPNATVLAIAEKAGTYPVQLRFP